MIWRDKTVNQDKTQKATLRTRKLDRRLQQDRKNKSNSKVWEKERKNSGSDGRCPLYRRKLEASTTYTERRAMMWPWWQLYVIKPHPKLGDNRAVDLWSKNQIYISKIPSATAPCETGVRTAFLANIAQAHNFSLEFSLNVPEIHLVPFSP